MAAVQLPNNCNHQNLIKTLGSAGILSDFSGKIAVQIPDPCFISTAAMSFLVSWGLLQRNEGGRFVCVGNPDTCSYLSRMDLFDTLDISFDETFERHSEKGRFIPVKLVHDVRSCQKAVDDICDLVLHQFDNPREFIPAMEWAVNEVIDNIFNHSHTPVPGVVCAQYFPNRHRIDIGICDMGIGIKASLEESLTLWSHGDAVTKALQRGVTRNPEAGSGNGLAGTLEITNVNQGEFHLWTGDINYCSIQGQEKGFSQISPVLGTGVFIRLDTNRPVDLSKTFIQEVDWTYIDATAQRLSEGDSLKIKDECEHTGMREPARRLRRKVLALLPDLESPLNLDFDGVNSASSSFLDELLGLLIFEIGGDEFRKKIRTVNASDQMLGMIEYVIAERINYTQIERLFLVQ